MLILNHFDSSKFARRAGSFSKGFAFLDESSEFYLQHTS